MEMDSLGKNANVAILGASAKPERYSYKAFCELRSRNYNPIPVNPSLDEIEGVKAYKSLSEIPSEIDTVTVYLAPERSGAIAEEIIRKKPRRVIFNPGTENRELIEKLRRNGVEVVESCTLVMLRTGQF